MSWKYKKIKLKWWKTIDEHRYLIQINLWRELLKTEIVHHINFNKSDNRLCNLQIMTRKEHAKIHNKYRSTPFFTREWIIKWVKNRVIKQRNSSKISIEMYVEIFYLNILWFSCRKISKIINLHHTNIAMIIRWEHWSNEYYKYVGLV